MTTAHTGTYTPLSSCKARGLPERTFRRCALKQQNKPSPSVGYVIVSGGTSWASTVPASPAVTPTTPARPPLGASTGAPAPTRATPAPFAATIKPCPAQTWGIAVPPAALSCAVSASPGSTGHREGGLAWNSASHHERLSVSPEYIPHPDRCPFP